jgi:hypothetical protein
MTGNLLVQETIYAPSTEFIATALQTAHSGPQRQKLCIYIGKTYT